MSTTSCHFCQNQGERHLNAAHWTGTEYVRVNCCGGCRDELKSAPRRPRQARQQPILDMGGWAAIPGLNKVFS